MFLSEYLDVASTEAERWSYLNCRVDRFTEEHNLDAKAGKVIVVIFTIICDPIMERTLHLLSFNQFYDHLASSLLTLCYLSYHPCKPV
jgi:hypothetical protein